MENFSLVNHDEIQEKKTKMVEHKLVSFATIVALWTLVTFLIKAIRIILKWKYTQHKNNSILAAMLQSEAILSKKFRHFSSQLPRSRSQKPRSR